MSDRKHTRNDSRELARYLERYQIPELFDSPDLPFELHRYKKGSVLNARRDTADYLQFLVSGAIQIYSILEDGSKSPVCMLDDFSLLGDIEFFNDIPLPFFVEAASDIVCVELPLYDRKDTLLNDNRFLRTLLSSITRKLMLYARSETQYKTLEERLIAYLKHDRPDHMLCGVEKTAVQLRCSRRQLQRVLRELTEKQILEKTGKGRYWLRNV